MSQAGVSISVNNRSAIAHEASLSVGVGLVGAAQSQSPAINSSSTANSNSNGNNNTNTNAQNTANNANLPSQAPPALSALALVPGTRVALSAGTQLHSASAPNMNTNLPHTLPQQQSQQMRGTKALNVSPSTDVKPLPFAGVGFFSSRAVGSLVGAPTVAGGVAGVKIAQTIISEISFADPVASKPTTESNNNKINATTAINNSSADISNKNNSDHLNSEKKITDTPPPALAQPPPQIIISPNSPQTPSLAGSRPSINLTPPSSKLIDSTPPSDLQNSSLLIEPNTSNNQDNLVFSDDVVSDLSDVDDDADGDNSDNNNSSKNLNVNMTVLNITNSSATSAADQNNGNDADDDINTDEDIDSNESDDDDGDSQ
ncbi:hypothetical protein HK100_006320, partial [Physocladia obscura]